MVILSSASRRVTAAQKVEQALDLHLSGCSWPQVARQAGYSTASNACKAVTRYLRTHPAQSVEELRQVENLKLLAVERGLWQVIRTEHLATCSRGLVLDENEMPVLDDGPRIQAYRALVQVYTRRARLLGLDAPVVIRIEDEDAIDAEIEAWLAGRDQLSDSLSVPDGYVGPTPA